VLDRASGFADAEVLRLIDERCVPVAVDEWYHARRQDAEGDLYRRIVFQRDGMGPDRTTQGFYLAEADGTLVTGWNHRDERRLAAALREAGAAKGAVANAARSERAADPRFARTPPAGGLVVDVFARVLQAAWPEPKDRWTEVFQQATGRDHLWVTAAEHDALAAGHWPTSLGVRITRFHLIDNTRGEPPMWSTDDVKASEFVLEPAGNGRFRLRGHARAETKTNDRAYDLTLAGEVHVEHGKVTTFDLVATGDYRGHGRYTGNSAPPGTFTLGIAFVIAGDDAGSRVPPQGARDVADYLGPADPYPRDVTAATRADAAERARIERPGEVVFADAFESEQSFARWFEIQGLAEGRVVIEQDPAIVHEGKGALRLTAPDQKGKASGAGPVSWLGDDGHDVLHLRYWTRYAADYDQGNLHHTGGSLSGVAGTNKWLGMGGAGKRPAGDDHFSTRVEGWRDWRRLDPPGYLHCYTYWMDMRRDRDGNYWGNMLAPVAAERHVPQRAAWQCVELRVACNTFDGATARADGELAVWLDGTLYQHWRGFRWRSSPAVRLKRVGLLCYVHEARRDNTVWFDDVVVSTGYVGCERKKTERPK
jgi:hypothetical protein